MESDRKPALELTGDLGQRLRDQVITADEPGPLLHDFEAILSFLGPAGIEAGGKQNLISMK